MNDTTLPPKRFWWDQGARFNWTPDLRPCQDEREHCRLCGRQLVLTVEKSGLRARDTGEVLWERWHSCPKYAGSKLLRILTLGMLGVGWGHESHDADEPILVREWH